MNTQKICIIGDGLAGLTTAAILSEENIRIDLYSPKVEKKIKNDNRTTAISESNYRFLKKELHLKKLEYAWPCNNINLFYQKGSNYLNFINFNEKEKKLMYIVQNNKFKNTLTNIVIKKKNIKILKSAITKINFNSGSVHVKNKKIIYDLIVLSVGSQSFLYNKIDQGRSIKKDYKEVAITAFVKHNSKIENPSQFFLKEGPFAILPLKKNVFSLVWSVNYNFFNKNKKNIKILIDKKINELLDKKVKKNISNINNFNIYLNLKKKYFKKNTLIIGDGLHAVHPIAGQGFNLVLRDIMKLKELINKNLKLGLLMKESAILKDFYQARKPENTLVGLGIDLTNTFFKENKIFSPLKDLLLRNLNNFQFIKKISKKIADSGVR